MNWKQTFSELGLSIWRVGAALLTLNLVHGLLNVASVPFDLSAPWRVQVGWLIVFIALECSYDAALAPLKASLCPRERRSVGSDPYTLAVAELRSEARAKRGEEPLVRG